MSEPTFTTDPVFLAEVNRLAAERAADPRTNDERDADDLLDGIVLAVTSRVRTMLEEDMARIRPALVAGLAAGVNVPLLSRYCIRGAFAQDDEDMPAPAESAAPPRASDGRAAPDGRGRGAPLGREGTR